LVVLLVQLIQVQQKNIMEQLGTTAGSLNTARQELAGSGAGTQTAALAFGGKAVPAYTGCNRRI
jgi:hypothetical protein